MGQAYEGPVLRRLAGVIALALAAGSLIVAPGQAHDAPKRCGKSYKEWGAVRYTKLRGHNVTGCGNARKWARRYMRQCYGPDSPRPCSRFTIVGWDMDHSYGCTREKQATGRYRVRCLGSRIRRQQVIHFRVLI